jgi:hypothetical protein
MPFRIGNTKENEKELKWYLKKDKGITDFTAKIKGSLN